ncbi:helix-turn-helix domain-containing protein [Paenibacillus sp. GYB003]|uniref:helix-turn-helix domain-containing protein n=1 Tax=Paenibacillus sp. GYB003 TaxID=2994392 RepID=UPI002F96C855
MKWSMFHRQTLMFRIFVSFLSIILLFSVFNALSVHLFNNGVQKEIIQYNRLILKNTAERYQTHFDRIKTMLFDLYSDERVTAFNRQMLAKNEADIEYWRATEVLKELRSHAYNPMFYLNNLLIYYDSRSFLIEKEGSVPADMFFGRFYASGKYPLSYWKGQLDRSDNYVLHPQDTFTVSTLSSSVELPLIPFSLRMPSSNYQVIALMDGRKLQEAFYGIGDDRRFMIVREDGSLLYRSTGELSAADVPSFEGGDGYGLAGDYYYFKETPDGSDFTYVTAVPYSDIASRVRNANLSLLLVSAVSIAIGLLASVYFSGAINRPVKQMVASIVRREPLRLRTAIREFDLIHENIGELMKEKEGIHKELQEKRSLLTSFGYINKLKSITSDINEWKDIAVMDEPFFVVLFQIRFKLRSVADSQMKTERMAYYIQEYINLVFSERLPTSHTFQIENDEILSIVRGKAMPDGLDELLAMLKTILDRDNAFFLVTIAVSPMYGHSGQVSDAYREVQDLARQARPVDESQIIRERRTVPAQLVLTVAQEQELYANVQAGNRSFCVAFMERIIDQMEKKEATLGQLQQLAEGVIARVAKILEPFGADAGEGGGGGEAGFQARQHALMRECCTPEQFKRFYGELFLEAGNVVQSKKGEQDAAIAFVMDYVENRFAEDISLDLLADKLNLSVAYLSVYIKEKTGSNFSEHLNAVRIRKAKELLADSELSVQEISERIGYRNATSFIRMFKKMTGVPPGEYRKHRTIEAELANQTS